MLPTVLFFNFSSIKCCLVSFSYHVICCCYGSLFHCFQHVFFTIIFSLHDFCILYLKQMIYRKHPLYLLKVGGKAIYTSPFLVGAIYTSPFLDPTCEITQPTSLFIYILYNFFLVVYNEDPITCFANLLELSLLPSSRVH